MNCAPDPWLRKPLKTSSVTKKDGRRERKKARGSRPPGVSPLRLFPVFFFANFDYRDDKRTSLVLGCAKGSPTPRAARRARVGQGK